MDIDLFQELLEGAGTNQTGLAHKVGISRQLLNRWRKVGVPAKHVVRLEHLTGVSRKRIRPDVFDDEFILRG